MRNRGLFAGALLIASVGPIQAQMAPVDSALARQVDAIANQVLQSTGVPSASVAVVKNGRVAYANAYGAAKLDPRAPATPDLRYAIGSISKQFTAVAILLLQQEGKLRLDDPVSRFIPGLTRGNEVTVRQLLSHTSGYQDFWPQDYVMPGMLQATTPQAIADAWAKREWSSRRRAACPSFHSFAHGSSFQPDSRARWTSTSVPEPRTPPATYATVSDHFAPRPTRGRDGCGPPASSR